MSVLTEQAKLTPRTLFSRVLVGVDTSEEQRSGTAGAALAEGQLTLLAAYDFAAGTPMVHGRRS